MSDQPDSMELAALVCSRVCHDVVNPVGAIINGLEVLDEENDDELRTIALDLIRKSADQASAKLKFARMAFGASSAAGATIDLHEARDVATSFVNNEKMTLNWQPTMMAVPKDQAKLILNLIVASLATVPRGGTIDVGLDLGLEDVRGVTIEAKGMNARIPEDVEKALTGRTPWSLVGAHSIQPFYTGLLVEKTGMAPPRFALDGEVVTISTTRATDGASGAPAA